MPAGDELAAARRAAVGPLVHTGDSANIAFYRERRADGPLWCEVLRADPYVRGVGFVRGGASAFHVRVYRGRVVDLVAEFTFTPRRRPAPGPLSAVVVTRLVRQALVPGPG